MTSRGRPIILDLFCCAGGAGSGYARAGFDVVGIDIEPQPHYPFEFHQMDAIGLLKVLVKYEDTELRYAAIHASPPCQRYSQGAKKWGTQDNHPDLIWPVRKLLREIGLPYVIENIPSAAEQLLAPVSLCGTMFGLGVFRHRLFEAHGFAIDPPAHETHQGRVGDGHYFTVTGHTGGSSTRDGWVGGSVEDWREAMGMDWGTVKELSEAIPPSYTEYIGYQLRAALMLRTREAVAA